MSIDETLRIYNCGIGMTIIIDKKMFDDIDNEELVTIINSHKLIPIGIIIKNNESIIDYDLIKNKLNN